MVGNLVLLGPFRLELAAFRRAANKCDLVRGNMVKPSAAINIDLDECDQRSEWRRRLISSVINRDFDDETLIAMLSAGFDQAHEEGVSDGADVCGQIGREVIGAARVALLLEKALRRLVVLNRQSAAAGSETQ